MKLISTPRQPVTATGMPAVNGAGKPTGNLESIFQIDESDVGISYGNYIGFGQGGRTIKASDVGMKVSYLFNACWACWKFA